VSETLGKKLLRNTQVSMLAWAWGTVMNIVRMLVLIAFLETAEYGLWVFAFTIMGYFVVYNFGMANTFIKYTAECNALKDYQRLSHLLSTGMSISLLLASAIMVVLVFFTDAAVSFFNLNLEHSDDSRLIILGVGITTALNIGFSVYNGALIGIHRMDIKNWIRVGVLTAEITLLAILLNLGYGLHMVMYLYITGVIVTLVLSRHYVHKYLPEVRINPLQARQSCLRDVVTLGGKMQLLGVVAMFVTSLDVVVFTKYGGAAFIGIYGAAQRFAKRAQGAAQQGFGALAPASADLIAQKEFRQLGGIYLMAQRLTAVGCGWIFAYLIVNADIIMRFVMAEKLHETAIFALSVLSASYWIHSLTGPGSSMLRGAGMPFREMLYQVLTAVFFFGLYLVFRHYDDPRYIIASWPVARGTASLIFVAMTNRFFKTDLLTPFRQTIFLMVGTLALAYAVRIGWDALPFGTPSTRWPAFALMLGMGIVYSILFFVMAWFLPGLTPSDKERILKFVPMGRRFVPARPQVEQQ
jgi:O-antigen/teichoic acid export membrane protein